MDKVAQYREYVQTLLSQYAKDDISNNEVEVQLIFDTERDHYQWMNVGWQEFSRVYRCIIHFDIKDGKIWLQQNLTDRNPAEELVWVYPGRILFWVCSLPTNDNTQITGSLESKSVTTKSSPSAVQIPVTPDRH